MKTALVAGSTGLIGKQLLQLLLESNRYTKVIAITRQDLPVHSKLQQIKTDFDSIGNKSTGLKADDVFCCLGTTMAKAGSKEKFYQVDFYYPLLLAKISKAEGAKQYLLVSALGADKKAVVYYNQVKGEIEEAVRDVEFETLHVFRPSLLLGPREEKRVGEDVAKFVYRFFGFLIPSRYKAIQSVKVARAMLALASQEQKGFFLHESAELQKF
jgi:uncharacterized protein YbjT (DUF2867 family)